MHNSEVKNNTLDVVRSAVLRALRKAEKNPWQKIKLSVESMVSRRIRPLILVVRPVACERAPNDVMARIPIKFP